MSGTMHAYAVDLGRLRAITAQPSNRDEPLSTSPQAERLRRLLAGEAPSQSTYDDYVDLEWLCASVGTPPERVNAFETGSGVSSMSRRRQRRPIA